MQDLPPRQRRALEAIINDVRTHGAAPSTSRVGALANLGTAAWVVLDGLRKRGYVEQPYEDHGAPWIPIRDLDGAPLRLELVRGEGELEPPLDPVGVE